MNVKKILSVICTIACAFLSVVQQPVAEALSVEKQEANAYRFTMKTFGRIPTANDSEISRKFTPIVQKLQKRICDINGIEITSQKYRNSDDYKTKIHPAVVVDNCFNSLSEGAGYIYIGDGSIKDYAGSSMIFSDQYPYMGLEKDIAHEIGHNLAGHNMRDNGLQDELEAEKLSIKLTDRLPEGGWGLYLVALFFDENRPEQNQEVMNSFEKATKRFIKVEAPAHVQYKSSSGKFYRLDAYPTDYVDAADAYFGGQIAYCIAKGALTPGSLQVVDNHLKDEIKFNSGCLLICRSSKLPNGYRVLTGLGGRREHWAEQLSECTDNHWPLDKYYEIIKKNSAAEGSHSVWRVWLACAVACDFVGMNK